MALFPEKTQSNTEMYEYWDWIDQMIRDLPQFQTFFFDQNFELSPSDSVDQQAQALRNQVKHSLEQQQHLIQLFLQPALVRIPIEAYYNWASFDREDPVLARFGALLKNLGVIDISAEPALSTAPQEPTLRIVLNHKFWQKIVSLLAHQFQTTQKYLEIYIDLSFRVAQEENSNLQEQLVLEKNWLLHEVQSESELDLTDEFTQIAANIRHAGWELPENW